jgi:hypothetical protein
MRAVECDPAIITLPGASINPLPPPGSIAFSPPPAMPTANPAGPAILAPGQYGAGWDQPGTEEPEPAWRAKEQPPDLPWWLRNQPPDDRR